MMDGCTIATMPRLTMPFQPQNFSARKKYSDSTSSPPLYSPGLTLRDFVLFSRSKMKLNGRRFADVDTIKSNVIERHSTDSLGGKKLRAIFFRSGRDNVLSRIINREPLRQRQLAIISYFESYE